MHDIRPEGADRPEHAPGAERDARGATLDQRERERAQPELVRDGAGSRRNGDDVAALGRAPDERGDDTLGAAGSQLLDHVQDPHRQRPEAARS